MDAAGLVLVVEWGRVPELVGPVTERVPDDVAGADVRNRAREVGKRTGGQGTAEASVNR